MALRSGIVAGGGTPSHRWLEVSLAGIPTGLKVLAAAEDVPAERARLMALLGASVPREELDVIRPDAWPPRPMFSCW